MTSDLYRQAVYMVEITAQRGVETLPDFSDHESKPRLTPDSQADERAI